MPRYLRRKKWGRGLQQVSTEIKRTKRGVLGGICDLAVGLRNVVSDWMHWRAYICTES
jgi:hypothetical protein